MKEPQAGDFWKDALARWNRLPSEEGVTTVVRGADRKRLVLRRESGVWSVLKPSDVGSKVVEVDLPTTVLLPAFVNAHTHLDLTHVGPREHDSADPRGFASWVEMVRRERATDGEAIRASVREGIEKSLLGGVVAVGDIAGAMRTEPVDELRDSPLAGVSFVEFFGLGERQQPAIDAMRLLVRQGPVVAGGVRLGLQPHAMYSAGLDVFRAAVALHKARGVALSTHLAESAEEWLLITRGEGPLREFLESMGIEWKEPIRDSPTLAFTEFARREPWLIAHANGLGPHDLTAMLLLSRCVAYCARGHAYFGHERLLGVHPWRHLLRVGARVCLATDSIINLPSVSADRLSPLDDARFVFRRDRLGKATHDRELAKLLVKMVTTDGAYALGINPSLFNLRPGPVLGIVGVEVGELKGNNPIVGALESDTLPELLALSEKREAALLPKFWAGIYA